MSQVHDATLEDIFLDDRGQPWIVVGRCDSPYLIMERLFRPDDALKAAEQSFAASRISGGINGCMWNGFKKLEVKNG